MTQFLRRHAVRIVIGTVLVMAVYGALLVWVPYQREQRIAKEMEAYGGIVEWQYFGPNWIPPSIQERLRFCNRIVAVTIGNGRVIRTTPEVFQSLGTLTRVRRLYLLTNRCDDACLEKLKHLTSLQMLYLYNADITDAGLEYLKGMTDLREFGLGRSEARTTDDGRARIRMALPNSKIYPYP